MAAFERALVLLPASAWNECGSGHRARPRASSRRGGMHKNGQPLLRRVIVSAVAAAVVVVDGCLRRSTDGANFPRSARGQHVEGALANWQVAGFIGNQAWGVSSSGFAPSSAVVTCPGPQTCYADEPSARGSGATVEVTTDGGQTWVAQALPPGVHATSGPSCPTVSRCVMAGYRDDNLGFGDLLPSEPRDDERWACMDGLSSAFRSLVGSSTSPAAQRQIASAPVTVPARLRHRRLHPWRSTASTGGRAGRQPVCRSRSSLRQPAWRALVRGTASSSEPRRSVDQVQGPPCGRPTAVGVGHDRQCHRVSALSWQCHVRAADHCLAIAEGTGGRGSSTANGESAEHRARLHKRW